jgi:regulator of protease activity HflC (stomatin/prohibitin superfamily)
VPPATTICVFRFGKLCRILSTPGLTWVAPGGEETRAFTGIRSHRLPELHVVDAGGNPIEVRALLEYSVRDPAALQICLRDDLTVLFNAAEQVVRTACSR